MFDATALERIQVQAREIDPLKVALATVAAIPYILGWVISKAFTVAWVVISWTVAAGKVGWQDARKPKAPTLRSGYEGVR